MYQPVIFREYDIRGKYNIDYDLDFVTNLGKSYAKFLAIKNPDTELKITVGFDARLSSPEICEALIKGLNESGVFVYRIGLVTSPMSYFTTFNMDVQGAVMITGSHNPPEFNGFKISVGKTTIHGSDILKLQEYMDNKDYVTGSAGSKEYDIYPEYVERYRQEFKNIKDFPFVLDCGNGAAGCIVRELYEGIGLKPNILFEEPDGNFPNHHPDPTVDENLVDLKAEVLKTNAKIGIGFDGDGDRIGVVDNTGKTILGDELLILFSRFVLKENKGAKIIGDVKCSDRMYADVEKHGGIPIMWKTGHSLIKEKIKKENSPFGGELSGHIFFSDRNYGYDDALYAGLRILEIISDTGKSISDLLEDLPTAFNTPEIRIDTTEEKKHSIVSALQEAYSKPSKDYTVNLQDGIRVSYKGGWALARASNTQPVLVLRFEANTEELLKKIRDNFENIVNPLL